MTTKPGLVPGFVLCGAPSGNSLPASRRTPTLAFRPGHARRVNLACECDRAQHAADHYHGEQYVHDVRSADAV
ncbi:MAG TPA: hypothetical protein VFY12_07000, partial [Arenimonas sp.]|nr:hypothetical protein [Arenimonas sp.]